MLNAARACELLAHERADVRALAADFFVDAPTVGPLRFRDLQPALLAADDFDRGTMLRLTARLALDADAGACLLELLELDRHLVNGFAFRNACAALPWSTRATWLEREKAIAGSLRAHLAHAAELDQLELDELWERLDAFAARCDRIVYVNRIDHGAKKNLIRALIQRERGELAGRASDWIDERECSFYASCFALEILAERPNPRCFERLVALIDECDEYRSHLAACALGAIPGVPVEELVARGRADSESRCNFHDALARLRTPAAERGLIDLRLAEPDPGWRTHIAHLLCESLTTEALPELVRACMTDDYDPSWVELDASVDSACVAAGYSDEHTEALGMRAATTRAEAERRWRASRELFHPEPKLWVSTSKKSKQRRERRNKRSRARG